MENKRLMRFTSVFVAVAVMILIAVCVAIGSPAKQRKKPAILTKIQAMDAVRAFEDNRICTLKVDDFEEYDDGFSPSGKSAAYYLSETAVPDPDNSWEVDAASGEVKYAHFSSRIAKAETKTPYGAYTKAQCRKIAQDFARAKYNKFDSIGFKLVAEKWKGNGWKFGWRQIIPYGAYCDNFINITVNPETGLIQSYSGSRYPVFSPQKAPSITPAKSVKLANKAAGIVKPISNDTPLLYANWTTIYWRVGVAGRDSKNRYVDIVVELDAYTGFTIKKLIPLAVLCPMPGMFKSQKK